MRFCWLWQVPVMDSGDSPTHRALARLGRQLDLLLNADLGELVEGHHVVATGLELATPSGAVLHHEFVPAITEEEIEASPFFSVLGALHKRRSGYSIRRLQCRCAVPHSGRVFTRRARSWR